MKCVFPAKKQLIFIYIRRFKNANKQKKLKYHKIKVRTALKCGYRNIPVRYYLYLCRPLAEDKDF